MPAAPSPPYAGPPNKFSAGDNKPITRIVVHCTVSPCERGGARTIAGYFRGPSAGGSAQYVVDPGETIQAAWDSVICWHAPPNPGSLGVELCDPMPGSESNQLEPGRWDDQNHDDMLLEAAALTAGLCQAFDVPMSKIGVEALRAGKHGVCGHDDVSEAFHQSDHWDPGKAFPWRRFMRMVRTATEDPARTNDGKTSDGLTKAQRQRLRNRLAGLRADIAQIKADLGRTPDKKG